MIFLSKNKLIYFLTFVLNLYMLLVFIFTGKIHDFIVGFWGFFIVFDNFLKWSVMSHFENKEKK